MFCYFTKTLFYLLPKIFFKYLIICNDIVQIIIIYCLIFIFLTNIYLFAHTVLNAEGLSIDLSIHRRP